MHDVAKKHQTKIARDTLRMSDAGALIMGGMSKAEARAYLAGIGWGANKIADLEDPSELD